MQHIVTDRALPLCLERIMIAIPAESQHQCAEAAAAALDEMLLSRGVCACALAFKATGLPSLFHASVCQLRACVCDRSRS